jgi:phosphohistidine phosphatase SixA
MLGEEVRHLDRQDHQRNATDTGIEDLAATSNWMRRTGWAETYKGVDRRLLLALCEARLWRDTLSTLVSMERTSSTAAQMTNAN